MMEKSVRFDMLGGGVGIICDLGNQDLWALRLGGAVVALGHRSDWIATVDPFPHAWRVVVKLREDDERTIWFDVAEADAMKIEAYIGENR